MRRKSHIALGLSSGLDAFHAKDYNGLMTTTGAGKRFVCFHGHFYQPPRENPWTGVIDRQASAGEYHDWNERITFECYTPNASARVLGPDGKPAAQINNYGLLSFNFGPTLLSWLERAEPETYRSILTADRNSARRLSGHGNAIAQAYNHAIMPLSNNRDLATQLRWGLADFRLRFARAPEALWLPELACDGRVLAALVDHGLKYAILAPHQARRVRPRGARNWSDVAPGTLDTRRAYRWSGPGRRSLALFFYDGGLAHRAAFGALMSNSPRAADEIERTFGPKVPESQLVSVATDGETYGHHQKFAEMGLAHLLSRELPRRKIEVTNYGYYLAAVPPTWDVEIAAEATSWSCAHGVSRWSGGCDCGADGKSVAWRRPLREAIDWLRDQLIAIFEGEGAKLLRDPWAARDEYISVILERRPPVIDDFLSRHRRGRLSDESRRKALDLLELQRHALLMFTSCGWFFSDFGGYEPVQNLRYCARAIELARALVGRDLEAQFTARLQAIPYGEHGDGESVYRRLVLPAAV